MGARKSHTHGRDDGDTLNAAMNAPADSILPFPPITKQRALRIAAHATGLGSQQLDCFSKKPATCRVPEIIPRTLCWYVYVPAERTPYTQRDSRLLIISRENGNILYDGPAGDGA